MGGREKEDIKKELWNGGKIKNKVDKRELDDREVWKRRTAKDNKHFKTKGFVDSMFVWKTARSKEFFPIYF